MEPAPTLQWDDSCELRARIIALTASEATQLGIGKSTLHYLRRRAKGERSFTTYRGVRSKVQLTAGIEAGD
ncbi:MAG: hypothetical protein ABSD99_06275 [Candidatus Bathyarchaeia archaeon]